MKKILTPYQRNPSANLHWATEALVEILVGERQFHTFTKWLHLLIGWQSAILKITTVIFLWSHNRVLAAALTATFLYRFVARALVENALNQIVAHQLVTKAKDSPRP